MGLPDPVEKAMTRIDASLERSLEAGLGNPPEAQAAVASPPTDPPDAPPFATPGGLTQNATAPEPWRSADSALSRLIGAPWKDWFFYRCALDGSVLQASPSADEILGADVRGIASGFFALRTRHPQNREALRLREQALQGGHPPAYALEIRRPDASCRCLQLTEAPVLDDSGRVVAIAGVAHDLTDHRRAAPALQALLQGSFTLVGEAFFPSLARELATLLQTRQAFVGRLLPGEPARVQTLAVWVGDTLAPNFTYSLPATPCEETARRSLCFFSSGVRHLFPRDIRLVEWNSESYLGVPLPGANGEPIGLLAVVHDRPIQDPDAASSLLTLVAPRAAAELQRLDALAVQQESEERYRLLVEHSQELFVELMRDGVIRYASPNFAEALKQDPLALKGRPFIELAHPDDQALLREHLEAASARLTFRLRHGEDRWCWTDASARRFLTHTGEPRLVLVCRDITERREAETARTRLETQLRQAQKLEAIGTLAGGIAHDFNNILAAIICYAELAKDDTVTQPAVQESLDNVLKASHRAKDLVRQILAFSRQAQPERIPLELHLIVKEALKLLRSTLPSTIDMASNIGPNLPMVLADATQIHQVLMNLCANAAYAMRGRQGRLEVNLSAVTLAADASSRHPDLRPGQHVLLQISDNGCGMSEETLRRIFEPFFTTKAPGEGTGLGLAVVHGIVREHGGVILAESRAGQGTSFFIYLPALPRRSAPPATATEAIPHGQGERILYVDDESSLCRAAERMLTRLGYQPVVFTNPLDALAAFQAQPAAFDALVTDLTMPGMTGVDLAAAALEIRPNLPVLLVTGFGGVWLREAAQTIAIRNVLIKPLDMAGFGRMLYRTLHGPAVGLDELPADDPPLRDPDSL